MPRSTVRLVLPMLLLVVASACRGIAHAPVVSKPQQITEAMPTWYPTPPRKQGVFRGAGFERSQSLDLAVTGARLSAQVMVAEERAVWLKAFSSRFEEQVGSGDSASVVSLLTRMSRSVVDEVLDGVETQESKVLPTPRGYAVWTLVEQPAAASQSALLRRLQADSARWTRIRALEAIRELETQVRAYDERRRREP